MKVGFGQTLSLSIGLITFSSVLLGSSQLNVQAAEVSPRNSRPATTASRQGENGRNGQDGQDQAVVLDAESIRLDLSGKDGGAGGNGGNGGNGGSLPVLYRSLDDLRLVQVVSEGGQGGRPGRGGSGGSSCYCEPKPEDDSSDDDGSSRCTTRLQGTSGLSGEAGHNGSRGHLYLANQDAGLSADKPTQQIDLSAFGQGKTISLSKNLWTVHPGALVLLAPGSVVAEDYRRYLASRSCIYPERGDSTVY